MFQPVSKAETRVFVSTETLTDTEREVSEMLRKIQSYIWKLNNKVGKAETARKNIEDAFRIIDELRKESNISSDLAGKVEDYRQKFKSIIP